MPALATALAPRPDRGLLSIEGLTVAFPLGGAWVPVVRGASLAVGRGEIVGLVGESGSGKSLTALSVLGLVPPPGRITGGAVRLDGRDLVGLPERELRAVRGGRVGMVFQEPMTALNPVYTVGFQIAEAVRAHRPMPRRAALAEAERLLARVALPEPRRRLGDYPHQLSGGQRQRVMIAVALAGEPDLLLADEPTTALDVSLQAQVLALLARLRDELGLSVLLITHDLAVVAETCDRAVVMYAGEVVEEGPVPDLFRAPAHPYTRGLLASRPDGPADPGRGRRWAAIPGQPPAPGEVPAGCAFRPRCPEAFPECAGRHPALYPVAALPDSAGGPAGASRAARCLLLDPEAAPGEAPAGTPGEGGAG